MPNVIDVVEVYTDGACAPNPGSGAIGAIVLDENGQERETCSEYISDETTSNRAEYKALIRGLELAAGVCTWKAICFSDSSLMIKQLNRNWRIRNKELLELNKEVRVIAGLFKEVKYRFASRDNPHIKKADRLAKEALFGGG